MSVAVFPRLADLLEEQHLTLEDLERRIAARFGIDVDTAGLQRLVERSPLRQTDLELAGAAAAALGVGLDDLFTVAALPGTDEAQWQVLDPAESLRLAALLDREAPLTPEEQADLAHLLDRYGQRLHERRMQDLARSRGVRIEDVERERAERMTAALRWWETFDRDPARDEVLARAAVDLQARWPARSTRRGSRSYSIASRPGLVTTRRMHSSIGISSSSASRPSASRPSVSLASMPAISKDHWGRGTTASSPVAIRRGGCG